MHTRIKALIISFAQFLETHQYVVISYICNVTQGWRKVVNSGGLNSQQEKIFYGEKLNPMENS